jgi:CRP-like cAMP-binding protein
LFREKELGTAFYVVIVGVVDVQKAREGQSVVVASLGVGACFGEMALVRDDVRAANAPTGGLHAALVIGIGGE